MGGRARTEDSGRGRSDQTLDRVCRDGRNARLDAGLRQADVAARLGISRGHFSRVELGAVRDLSIDLAVRWYAVLGLDLVVRGYPAGDPLRDAAQLALLARFRAVLHASFVWRTEVPLPVTGDRRAWDGAASNTAVRIGVEGETRIRDLQALERRLALKERDGGMDRLILVVADTRANRSALRSHPDVLAGRFPIPGRIALQRLSQGLDPGGNAVVFL